jgi:hypothetical protein
MFTRAFVSLLTLIAVSLGQDAVFSGPQPGEPLPPFRVLAVNGSEAGREVDYIAEFGDAPTLVIFAHTPERSVQANIWPVDRFATERASTGLKTLVVFLTADKIQGEAYMRHWVRALGLSGHVGVALEGIEGPGAYGLNKTVAITAVFAQNRKVTANHSYIQAGYHGAMDIIQDLAKVVGGQVPDPSEFLYGPGNGGKGLILPPDADPKFLYGPSKNPPNYPGKAAMDGMAMGQKDRNLVVPVEVTIGLARATRSTSTAEQVASAIEQLKAWAGTDVERKKLLARRIAALPPADRNAQLQVLKTAIEP